ncbi:MAG: gliding motility lipoprotein GldH, partial [Bacteroidales bacterium]
DGQIFQDTLGCILSDKYGNWTGKGNGRMKENKFLFKPKIRFVQKGTYKFTVRQGMREDQVEGISNFGISLYYYDKDKLK